MRAHARPTAVVTAAASAIASNQVTSVMRSLGVQPEARVSDGVQEIGEQAA
jgi:hypothetical protein